jgi:hypothetical protein
MRVAVLLLLLVACWREPARRSDPELSFVARVNAMSQLQVRIDALAPKLDVVMQRILGLASEAERGAIREDLHALTFEVRELSQLVRDARERGENPDTLAACESKLQEISIGLMHLDEELLHAKTRAEQEAFEELKKKLEGTHDDDGVRMRLYRRDAPALPQDRRLDVPLTP